MSELVIKYNGETVFEGSVDTQVVVLDFKEKFRSLLYDISDEDDKGREHLMHIIEHFAGSNREATKDIIERAMTTLAGALPAMFARGDTAPTDMPTLTDEQWQYLVIFARDNHITPEEAMGWIVDYMRAGFITPPGEPVNNEEEKS